MDVEQAILRLARLVRDYPTVDLLILHGSRARGDAHPGSDWDFGYLAHGEVDHLGLLHEITQVLGTDDVDLVDLRAASGLLRFRAASEGRIIAESKHGRFNDFALAAALHWYDVAPVVREAQSEFLAGM
ncbi:type VII toxin-antitoxin system MntA family adenylyltransferase antitoxin [Hoyosella altamirensis]|uniref:Putative nucleotidyltransferase n=1 Tax=Hoyosella altamirensis TaxID=616997 RepID=A0A839RJI3_9ACTN|nr:nucleotidyltransferase domain-containing protein [Hoyosella altamirensis]MBB3036567.1 putative nucleotidyltransferase [Hoyosella altamirensis]